MSSKSKIVAICGSTRSQSSNMALIQAFSKLARDYFEVTIFDTIAALPQFNPDLDQDAPPLEIVNFRNTLKAADGVFICTPEYAMGVPGTLKNAVDWTVSSAEFSKKPVALITASSLGQKAHASLLETLKIIEANISDDTQLLISYVKTKINGNAIITDMVTEVQIKKLIASFYKLITNE